MNYISPIIEGGTNYRPENERELSISRKVLMMKFNKLLCWHLKNHAMAWSEINDAKTIPRPVIWRIMLLSHRRNNN